MLFDWSDTDCFCFDVDSTVCIDEAIDELAKYLNKYDEVKNLTQRAMEGGLDFRTALEYRLNIIRPSRAMINKFMESRRIKQILTPGILDLIHMLHKAGKDIYLISGGMKMIIDPIAEYLGIPRENVFANVLLFHKDGRYRGFDINQPTSSQGGKGRVISWLKSHRNYQKVVMIGDGMTDMEASPPADIFVGFGGNVVRPEIKQSAPVFFTSFFDFMQYLDENQITN